jgi:hypothetical protein
MIRNGRWRDHPSAHDSFGGHCKQVFARSYGESCKYTEQRCQNEFAAILRSRYDSTSCGFALKRLTKIKTGQIVYSDLCLAQGRNRIRMQNDQVVGLTSITHERAQ